MVVHVASLQLRHETLHPMPMELFRNPKPYKDEPGSRQCQQQHFQNGARGAFRLLLEAVVDIIASYEEGHSERPQATELGVALPDRSSTRLLHSWHTPCTGLLVVADGRDELLYRHWLGE